MNFEDQLEEFKRSFVVARSNRWHGGDLLDEEFRPYLRSLGAGVAGSRSHSFGSDGSATSRANPWREVLPTGS